ncbi:MAG: HEAT repeat domain-containing protein, partial [Candidatus Omnitrophica bacterium]|nr:HEAT repeat domain-containing protein [Candidatus Omnitrophota bacterium]
SNQAIFRALAAKLGFKEGQDYQVMGLEDLKGKLYRESGSNSGTPARKLASAGLTQIGNGSTVTSAKPMRIACNDPLLIAQLLAEAHVGAEVDKSGARDFQKIVVDLDSSNSDTRKKAVIELGKSGDNRAIQPLIKALNDDNYEVSRSAVVALYKLGNTSGIPILIKDLKNGLNNFCRRSAAEFLGQIKNTEACVSLLKALAIENDIWVSEKIISSLGLIGDKLAIEPLARIAQLELNNFEVRNAAIIALGEIGDVRVVPLLITLAKDKRLASWRDFGPAIALGKIGDPQAVPTLIQVFNDCEIYQVRFDIVKALAQIGDERSTEFLKVTALPVLLEALTTEDFRNRIGAIEALEKIKDARAVTPLIDVLQEDPLSYVSFPAGMALLSIQKKNPEVQLGKEVLTIIDTYRLMENWECEKVIKSGNLAIDVFVKYWCASDFIKSDFFTKFNKDEFAALLTNSGINEKNKQLLLLLYSTNQPIQISVSDFDLKDWVTSGYIQRKVSELINNSEIRNNIKVLSEIAPDKALSIIDSLSLTYSQRSVLPAGAMFGKTWAAENAEKIAKALRLTELSKVSTIAKLFVQEGRLKLPTETEAIFSWGKEPTITIPLPGKYHWYESDVPLLKELLNSKYPFYKEAAARALAKIEKEGVAKEEQRRGENIDRKELQSKISKRLSSAREIIVASSDTAIGLQLLANDQTADSASAEELISNNTSPLRIRGVKDSKGEDVALVAVPADPQELREAELTMPNGESAIYTYNPENFELCQSPVAFMRVKGTTTANKFMHAGEIRVRFNAQTDKPEAVYILEPGTGKVLDSKWFTSVVEVVSLRDENGKLASTSQVIPAQIQGNRIVYTDAKAISTLSAAEEKYFNTKYGMSFKEGMLVNRNEKTGEVAAVINLGLELDKKLNQARFDWGSELIPQDVKEYKAGWMILDGFDAWPHGVNFVVLGKATPARINQLAAAWGMTREAFLKRFTGADMTFDLRNGALIDPGTKAGLFASGDLSVARPTRHYRKAKILSRSALTGPLTTRSGTQ